MPTYLQSTQTGRYFQFARFSNNQSYKTVITHPCYYAVMRRLNSIAKKTQVDLSQDGGPYKICPSEAFKI